MGTSKKLEKQLEDLALAPFSRLERKERDRRMKERIKRVEEKTSHF
jgi:hypothetical protein